MNLPNNLEEACREVILNPKATESHKKLALGTLDNLGCLDYLPKDAGEPPVSWDEIDNDPDIYEKSLRENELFTNFNQDERDA